MAEPANPAAEDAQAYVAGDMPIGEHRATYRAFDYMVRFGSLGVACLVLFLVMWFCAGAGFFPAFVVSAILGAVGGWFLRIEPPSIDTL